MRRMQKMILKNNLFQIPCFVHESRFHDKNSAMLPLTCCPFTAECITVILPGFGLSTSFHRKLSLDLLSLA